MSRAGSLARAFGADGTLNTSDVSGLGALAALNTVGTNQIDDSAITNGKLAADGLDASKLTTGTLPNERLASGAAVANLGYTPVNKAGDTLGGTITFSRLDDPSGVRFERRSWDNSTGGTTAYRTAYHVPGRGGDYFFEIYIGTDGTGNQRRYWYLDFNTGASTWMDYLHVEVMSAGWSWGQTSGYRRWTITSVANSWTTTLREDNAVGTLGSLTARAVANGSTSLRFGFSATSSANGYQVRVFHSTDRLRTASTVYYTDTNPF